MTNREIAEMVVGTIGENSSQGKCTWGDSHPDAHAELFGFYFEDLVADVEKIINENR